MSPAYARRNFLIALGDLGFALAAFACGLYDAPPLLTGLAAIAMLAYWSASRRRVLNRLRGAALASQTGLALAVLVLILAGAYGLGLGAGGFL